MGERERKREGQADQFIIILERTPRLFKGKGR